MLRRNRFAVFDGWREHGRAGRVPASTQLLNGGQRRLHTGRAGMRAAGMARRARFCRPLRSFLGQRIPAKGQRLPFAAPFAVSRTHRRARKPLSPLPFGQIILSPVSAFARRTGLGATPLHPLDGRPGIGRLLPSLLPLLGSLPARASGASDPCRKATPRRWRHPCSGPRGPGPRASSSPSPRPSAHSTSRSGTARSPGLPTFRSWTSTR